MSAEASRARWVIVVRRDRPDLHRDLSRAFASSPEVAVILDRRAAGRGDAPAGQRRAPLTAAELELWETVGFRLIPPPILSLHDPVPR
jgi:hypothetical protein